jgi:hypothetical protein
MCWGRTLASLAVGLGLLAAPAAGGAVQSGGPPAHATGGGAPPIIPSIVATRVARAETSAAHVGQLADAGQPIKAASELKTASRQAEYAWNAAKWLIKTSPPSVAGDAVPDVGGATAPVYAGREDTAFAAISVQHDVASAAIALINKSSSKSKALRLSWFNAINSSQVRRKSAVAYIHKLKAPGTFPTLMPGLVPIVNDEVKELNGKLSLTRPARTSLLRKSLVRSRARALVTRKLVNKYWPPVPAG